MSAYWRKLAQMPLDLANPVWVEDDEFDIDHHIRHVILPRPFIFEKLEQLFRWRHSTLMDRCRPLWELYIIEGLASGQVALYPQVHHAGIDGHGGVVLRKVLFSALPNPPPVKAPRARPRRHMGQLGVAEIAGSTLRRAGMQTVGLIKALTDLLAPLPEKTGKRRLGLPKGVQQAQRHHRQ